jgi:tetratricopeptide (TPR) repeat protein
MTIQELSLERMKKTALKKISLFCELSPLISVIQKDSIEMHRLVQLSTRRWLEVQGQTEKWKQEYIKRLAKAFPDGNFENWSTCQRLFPHAEAAVSQRPLNSVSLLEWAHILTCAAWYAWAQGNFGIAEKMIRKAVTTRRESLGAENYNTGISLEVLALVLAAQGEFEQAEKIHREALEGSEKSRGKEDRNTLTIVSNLAEILRHQGKLKQAEEMARRALEGRERVLSQEHPDILASKNNLAHILSLQGKYEKAKEMNRRALEAS